MTDTAAPLTLRRLPLPAKLVVTCFLLAVGAGYTAAMVQLHVQDSKSGKPMPDVNDVVLKYTGKKWFASESDVPKPVSTFVRLIGAPEEGVAFSGSGTMAPAFTTKDPKFNQIGRANEAHREQLRAERLGERDVLVLWANAPAKEREEAYTNDHFGVEAGKMPKSITAEFRSADDAVKVKSIIDARCAACHGKGGEQEAFPLQSYEQIAKYLNAPPTVPFHPGGDWVKVCEPISLEKLTQSTHAHLLSFAVLFGLTGLVFAFTSYPAPARCLLGPLVLLAVLADVSLWWLARQCSEWGPYFAMAIIGTGAAAGCGLAAQIVLSLFNMYGFKGKFVLLVLFALAGAGAWLVYTNQVKPALDAKQIRPAEATDTGTKTGPATDKKDSDAGVSKREVPLEKLFRFPVKGPDGSDLAVKNLPFKKDRDGGMVRAFFDKDSVYKDVMKNGEDEEKQKVTAERHGELAAFRAWVQAKDAFRRSAYDADRFELPTELLGKPITPAYRAGDTAVKVKTLIADRCVYCHQEGGENPEVQLDSYDKLLKHLK
jgi:cytochrome c553